MNESQQYIDKLNGEYIAKHLREQERDELIVENNIELLNEKIVYVREIEFSEFKEITVKKSTNGITDTTESFCLFDKVIEKKLLEDGELKDILLGIEVGPIGWTAKGHFIDF